MDDFRPFLTAIGEVITNRSFVFNGHVSWGQAIYNISSDVDGVDSTSTGILVRFALVDFLIVHFMDDNYVILGMVILASRIKDVFVRLIGNLVGIRLFVVIREP